MGEFMNLTQKIIGEILTHEGMVRQAYKDSVGVWTWSVGLTNATGHNVERYIGKPQDMEHCLRIFIWALEKYADDVKEAFHGHRLSEAQFAAALSFHWNTGAIKRASWVKKLKEGDVAGAKKAFMSWRKPAEIIPRREKERDLFFEGKWSGDGTVTEYARVTSKHTPVWSSAKRVDVSAEIKRIVDGQFEPSGPDAARNDPQPTKWQALIEAIAALINAIFGKSK